MNHQQPNTCTHENSNISGSTEPILINEGSMESSSKGPNNQTHYKDAMTKNTPPHMYKVQQVIRLKIVPPFQRDHLQNKQTFEAAVNNCYSAIISNFSPSFRQFLTISRTITRIKDRPLHTLQVTAPIEAESDILRMSTSGIQMLNRTIFPTTDEFWQYSPSNYPKKFTLRISNLPILCSDEELKNILEIPVDCMSACTREATDTDFGPIFNGNAHATVQVNSAEKEEALKIWSHERASRSTLMSWNEVPLYAVVPRLHSCRLCAEEGRKSIIGHDESWCRIRRRPIEPEPEPATTVTPIEATEELPNKSADNQQHQNQTTATTPQPTTAKNKEPKENWADDVPEESKWMVQQGKGLKKRPANPITPHTTPSKNKFGAYASDTETTPATSPRNRSRSLVKRSNNG